MTRRQEKLKNLMKDRNTTERGLTLYQVFCEVYPDIVEEYTPGKRDEYGVETVEYVYQERYQSYTRRLIKHLRKTDDAFRWLSPVPCKDQRGKIKEYKYVNIKPGKVGSYGYNLLTEANDFWNKHKEGTLRGLERTRRRIRQILYISEQEHEEVIKQQHEENEMVQSGVIDDPDEYFSGKKTRRSIQKHKNRLVKNKTTETV
jgi:hypothetical protein